MYKEETLIVFGNNYNDLKNKVYIKFLDKEKSQAIFYMPLIAPKYLKEYIKDNDIIEAYEVTNIKEFTKYQDKIYVLKYNNGIYNVKKGYPCTNKKYLFLLPEMGFLGSRNIYAYTKQDNYIILYRDNIKCSFKDKIYVDDEKNIDNNLIKYMDDALLIMPNILKIDK